MKSLLPLVLNRDKAPAKRLYGGGPGANGYQWLLAAGLMLGGGAAFGQTTPTVTTARQPMETLKRGIVAVKQADNKVFVSWRLLQTDASWVSFDLYR
ncbi:MAG TPA: hypothetical protein VF598_14805, partial [Hymenobacter sp.]